MHLSHEEPVQRSAGRDDDRNLRMLFAGTREALIDWQSGPIRARLIPEILFQTQL
jgi:hypothetical protein